MLTKETDVQTLLQITISIITNNLTIQQPI